MPPLPRQAVTRRNNAASLNQPRFQLQRPVRDRNANVITTREWEEMVEQKREGGKKFRYIYAAVILLILLVLGWFKYDTEFGMEIPDIEGVTDDNDDPSQPDGPKASNVATNTEAEEYYKLLNVGGRLNKKTNAETDEAKAKRLDNFRLKKQIKEAYQKHLDGYGQLVACGRSCEAHHKQVELAYNTLTSKVDRELYGVLLEDAKSRKTVSREELKQAYEKKKEEVLKTETPNTEERDMALEEIKDAYDILSNPEARTYYMLYGAKPPEYMKKVTAKHGGWGQELMLRTFKNKLVLSWLEYFDNEWVDIGVLVGIGIIGFVIPAVIQMPRILEMAQEIEDRERHMAELEKRGQH